MKIGNLVRFNHEKNGGPVHRIVSVMSDGMVELHDMGGYFAPHLFTTADDIAEIPPIRKHDGVRELTEAEADVIEAAMEVAEMDNARQFIPAEAAYQKALRALMDACTELASEGDGKWRRPA